MVYKEKNYLKTVLTQDKAAYYWLITTTDYLKEARRQEGCEYEEETLQY